MDSAESNTVNHPGRQAPAGVDARPLWAAAFETADGYCAVAASAYGIVACNWRYSSVEGAAESLQQIVAPLIARRAYGGATWLSEALGLTPHMAAARAALRSFAAGDYNALADLQLDTRSRTPLVAAIYRCVQAIPSGQVLSYGDVAHACGHPRAARAVGQAMAHNPLAPIVPCHRVIAAGGRIGGFGPGIPAKLRLLEREGAMMALKSQTT